MKKPAKQRKDRKPAAKKSVAKARQAFHLNHYSGTFLFLTAAFLGITFRSFLPSSATLTDVTWTGNVSTDWGNKDNWDPKQVPRNGFYNVTIAWKKNLPVLDAPRVVSNLTLSTTLDLKGFNFAVQGTLTAANGTIRRKCLEAFTVTHAVSLTRMEYVGEDKAANPCIVQRDLPVRDLALIPRDGAQRFELHERLDISGVLTLNAGTLDLQGNAMTAKGVVNNGKILLQGAEEVVVGTDNAGAFFNRGTWVLVGNRNGSADLIPLFMRSVAYLVVDPVDAGELFQLNTSLLAQGDTIVKGGSLRVGDGTVFTTTGSLLLDGGDISAAGSVVVRGGTTLKAGTFGTAGRGSQYFRDLTVNGATVSGAGAAGGITVDGNFTLSAGKFTSPMRLALNGNVTFKGGTFDPRIGTVTLGGAKQSITGSGTFYNLTKLATKSDTLSVQPHSLLKVMGTLTVQGSKTYPLLLRSREPGKQWSLDARGKRLLGNLLVQDCTNVNKTVVSCKKNCRDNGNNTKWVFK